MLVAIYSRIDSIRTPFFHLIYQFSGIDRWMDFFLQFFSHLKWDFHGKKNYHQNGIRYVWCAPLQVNINLSCCRVVVWHTRLGLFGHGTKPIHWLIAVNACTLHSQFMAHTSSTLLSNDDGSRLMQFTLHNVVEKWNYGVARDDESYETPFSVEKNVPIPFWNVDESQPTVHGGPGRCLPFNFC